MISAREVFLTQEDEIAVTAALVLEFPNVHFWNGWYWEQDEALEHDTLAHCIDHLVRVVIASEPWFPEFERTPNGEAFRLENDLLYLLIERPWRPDVTMNYAWEKDGRPAEIRKGSIQVLCKGSSDASLELVRRVWRALDTVMSNDLIHIAAPSGGVLYGGGKGRHPYYAGHNAIMWAVAAPQRVFGYIPRAELAPDRGWGCYPNERAIAEARAGTERIPVCLDAEAKVAVWQKADALPAKEDVHRRLQHLRGIQEHRVTNEPLTEECVVGPEPGLRRAAYGGDTFHDVRTGARRRIMIVPMRKDGRTPVARYRRKIARLKDNLGDDADTVHLMPRLRAGMDLEDFKREVGSRWVEVFTGLFGPPHVRKSFN